jgi:hypothetical protein
MTRRAPALAASLGLFLGACGGDSKPAAQADSIAAGAAHATASAPSTGTVAAAPGTPATVGPNGCIHDGRWRPCGLVDRLERAGLVVRAEKDTIRYDFLAVPGLHYALGRGDVQAFFYDDTLRLARDLAGLDTTQVAPKGTVRHWDAHPTLVHSANLVLILLTGNDHLVERVQLAVEAGAPQPDPPATAQPIAPVTSTPKP